ncbi:Uncharacterised protein [Lelliottia amnigena]|nr:Uncharacterised protein [Lelliottia amnigena]
MIVAGGALAMAVVLVETQLGIGAGCAEVASMILAVMVATATDALKMAIPVPNILVECLLSLADEIADWLHRLSAFRLALAPCFLHFPLLLLLLALHGLSQLLSLFFSNRAGAVKRANDLTVTHRMEPLATIFVRTLTTGSLSHAHPHIRLCHRRSARGGFLLSGNLTLTVQVM